MKIKDGFVLREIAGQAVVTATGKASESFHGMIKLNATAKDVWMWLAEGKSESEIAALLGEKYSIDVATAAADTAEMIEKMKKAGFLEE